MRPGVGVSAGRSVLAARPSPTQRGRLAAIPGRPSAAYEIEKGCVFAARCPYVLDLCRKQTPTAQLLGGHHVACHRAQELRGSLTRMEMAAHD
ncbi:hypothetical protein GCM10011579_033340 [Streptomyces albiflavescens]|uniref:Oligopeptide/dipeptide ABC transporter C-terminal domain-containing protein n=1 Tax=Streptomyces albiflavescens TaxID=1623582 RepID=A0A917Y323_9ACTN|nr:oligopeptide/dipeptide ABC transporter ATP-binding protein [Streptomyces albiflavescens]GGN64174.1 hypothetical protein GCM10011579_033340 [Streptomyces albiflavescens]